MVPKFRAWLKEEYRMTDVREMSFIDGEVYLISDVTDFYAYEEFKLMQSTGLKDKNGKEIYEGDIVVVEEYHNSSNYGRIFYSKKKACYRVEFKNLVNNFDLADVTVKFVAGNVYENLELLEGE